jgi:hypothetical protein
MTAISFDKLKFANRLKQAGVPSAHAQAEAEALADILEANLGELATKADILDAKPSWIADEPNSLLYANLVGLRMVVIGQKLSVGTKMLMTIILPKTGVGCGEFTNSTSKRCGARCLPHPTG